MFALVCLVASGQPACGLSEAACARCMPTASIGFRTMSVGVKPDEAVVKWFSLFPAECTKGGTLRRLPQPPIAACRASACSTAPCCRWVLGCRLRWHPSRGGVTVLVFRQDHHKWRP